MIELGLREHSANDGLFQERLDAFMDKSIADIKAFAERESRPFEETRRYVAEWHARYIFKQRDSAVSTEQQPSRNDKIRTTLYDASRILESLSETTGVQSFILAADIAADGDDGGFLGGSLTGREFWRRMRNGGESGARSFRTYCMKEMLAALDIPQQGCSADVVAVADAPETTVIKRTTAKNVKSELYEKARVALRRVSGIRNAEMKWTNPERLDSYGVRLVGWPSEIPAQNPSTLKQNQNKQLLQALENGSLRFERIVKETEVAETPVELDEDFSWAYDVGPSSVVADEDESFDYGEYLNPSEMYSETGDQDTEPPPVKRARIEQYTLPLV